MSLIGIQFTLRPRVQVAVINCHYRALTVKATPVQSQTEPPEVLGLVVTDPSNLRCSHAQPGAPWGSSAG